MQASNDAIVNMPTSWNDKIYAGTDVRTEQVQVVWAEDCYDHDLLESRQQLNWSIKIQVGIDTFEIFWIKIEKFQMFEFIFL